VNILADVNISPLVVAWLRAEGFAAIRVSEVLDPRAPDEDILAEAALRGAVIVSQDQDFSRLLATTGALKPSLINVRLSTVDAAELGRAIAAVLRAAKPDLAAGAIITLDDSGARVHHLPVG
jgi:predicted nuclease of predicted toxin-antitoxin system